MWVILCVALLIVPSFGWGFTITDLNNELVNDPASPSLGYAADITAGNDASLMAKLNLRRGGSDYVVSKGVVKRDDFLGTWGDVIDGIRTISNPTLNAKWTWRLDKLLLAKDTVDYGSALAASFFADMVTDGLNGAGGALTSGDVTTRTTRQGSRAEVLWGPGAFVTLNQISCALRSAGC